MKIFKELNKLGYKHYTEHTVEELDGLPLDSEERIIEQALVLRWFREKYKLLSFVDIDSSYRIYCDDIKFDLDIDSIIFKTYEEAELECLVKLIEIVKNESK